MRSLFNRGHRDFYLLQPLMSYGEIGEGHSSSSEIACGLRNSQSPSKGKAIATFSMYKGLPECVRRLRVSGDLRDLTI